MEKIPRVILILNVKISSTRSEDMHIYENDEPEEVAEQFCHKFSLPKEVKPILIKSIEDNLDIFIDEELGNTTTNLSSTVTHTKNQNFKQNYHKRSESGRNYGELLYTKGLIMKQKVEHMIQAQRQNMLEIEMKNSTFTPKITPYNIKTRNTSSGYSRKRSQILIDEINVCTFQPKINKYRGRGKENTENIDKCVKLYKEAEVLKKKLESKREKIFNEIYTFKPNVIKKRGISPMGNCMKSCGYLTKDKIQQLKNIFMFLNPDCNGCINKNTVSQIRIPDKMYMKCGRIFDELIELDESLTFDEFCKAMEILEREEFYMNFKTIPLEVVDV
ncbi:hypothetical protein SteCoe_29977 [Stentor coeruleus]|uniref:EF-hand domain-containing protein n=1 Tax=Stentor coeruleus TaxID=5963 RepID=A0A1R2B4K7_9CILI|nr:hypothetical protein SteCoe_29977 [Stentor coeruleus]